MLPLTEYKKYFTVFYVAESIELAEYILSKRGVEDPCKRCSGFGAYAYSHGATWRGGMGTTSFQHDVCDVCEKCWRLWVQVNP